MKNFVCSLSLVLSALLLNSCATRMSMVYLNDMEETIDYPVSKSYELKIQRNDKLRIIVSSKDPELSLAFNLPGTSGYRIANDGTVETNTPSARNESGYVVDLDGNIDFPILGSLHVEGLTRTQLTQMIKDQLIQRELLKNPLVQVDLLNFTFSVLGEVEHVGRFSVDGERVTILEAIAMAGDLKKTSGRIDRVAVFREFGDSRRVIHVDVRSKDLYLSPAYYLQQNDIVYVEPNGRVAEEQSSRRLRDWMVLGSTITSIMSLILLFSKL